MSILILPTHKALACPACGNEVEILQLAFATPPGKVLPRLFNYCGPCWKIAHESGFTDLEPFLEIHHRKPKETEHDATRPRAP